jgi:hypothetical protein
MPPLRVIQWTTGNVGRRALRAIIRNPALELVGVFAHSKEKVGRDAAELCGHDEPTGVLATDDVDALLALHPDACSYNPMWPDVDDLARLLEAGVNVSSTAAWITGQAMGAVDRLDAAARRGNATMFGTGINPGFANLFALVSTQICDRVDQIRVIESVDSADYDSGETELSVGYTLPLDTPGLVDKTRIATLVFADAVAMMADALGVELDDITFDADYTAADEDDDLGYMFIPKGTVAAIDGRWRGTYRGRDLIVLNVQWKKGRRVKPPFKVRHGYYVEIDGEPSVRSQLQIFPSPDWSEPGFMGLGMIMTAMPAVNAIPAVVAAPPGIVTHATLPLVTGGSYIARSSPIPSGGPIVDASGPNRSL